MYAKVPLQGVELEEFLQKERQEKEKEAAHKAVQERKERILEADEDDDDDSDIDDDSDEENEVEMQLGMDVDEDEKPDSRLTRKKKSSGAGGVGGLGASDEWDAAGEDGALSKHLSFDIYLKGNVSKSTSFFKSADGQTAQRFRMFPHIEKKRRVDEYGETIDVALWLRRDKVFQHEGRDEEKERKRVIDEEARVRFRLWLLVLVFR
jgi:cleavage and polyadenylation specificity factor subunit 2